jgi:hypothetical protein
MSYICDEFMDIDNSYLEKEYPYPLDFERNYSGVPIPDKDLSEYIKHLKWQSRGDKYFNTDNLAPQNERAQPLNEHFKNHLSETQTSQTNDCSCFQKNKYLIIIAIFIFLLVLQQHELNIYKNIMQINANANSNTKSFGIKKKIKY